MDMLQKIKEKNFIALNAFTALLESADKADEWKKVRRQILVSVLLEREFLHPEVADVSKIAKQTVAKLEASLVSLLKLIRGLDDVIQIDLDQLQSLHTEFSLHLELQHDKLLPLIRQHLSTAEREELTHVIEDAFDDYMTAEEIAYA